MTDNILYSKDWKTAPLNETHEYRQENGLPSLYYLDLVSKYCKDYAREFEMALFGTCAQAPSHGWRISWKIEKIE
jgi:hypothetical protein